MNKNHQHSIRYLTLIFFLSMSPVIYGQRYAPNDTLHIYRTHGTIYANEFVGLKTTSGEIFQHSRYTAAHWKIKLGSLVLVTNVNTGLQVVVRINDRCPNKGVIDLTRTAANAIGIKGCQHVTVRILPERFAFYWNLQETLNKEKPSWLPPNSKPNFVIKK